MGRWGTEELAQFQDDLPYLTLKQTEDRIKNYFSFEKCFYCAENLGNIKVSRIPYSEFLVHRFDCGRCKSSLLKLYSKNEELISAVGYFRGGKTYKILWHINDGMGHSLGKPENLGCPIPTGKDYEKKTGGRGRPQKYDYMEVDKLIWNVILKSDYTKHGFDTSRVQKYVNESSKEKYSRVLILNRLNDMELRGLVARHGFKSGNTWKWMWKKPTGCVLPHMFFQLPIRDQFKDRDLFDLSYW